MLKMYYVAEGHIVGARELAELYLFRFHHLYFKDELAFLTDPIFS